MATTQTINFRTDDETVEKLDALAAELSERAGGIEVDRSTAARAAMKRGIEALMADKKPKR